MLFIVNPRGGGGRAERVLRRARLETEAIELDLQHTRYAGHAAQLVRDSFLTQKDTVVVVGGDGTIHEVVNALMEREPADRPALGLLPGGTGNSLAHDLGLVELERARKALLQDHRQSMDLLRVTTSGRSLYAFNLVGWGLPASAGARAEAFRWMGASRYNIASLIEILADRSQTVELELAGENAIRPIRPSWFATPVILAPGCKWRRAPVSMMD